jgi:DNA-binding response OmpR family regulator
LGAISVKLLVVEDEQRMAELLYRGLGEEGHMVLCASDGNAGMEMIRAHEFDVIILDVMIPKLNGYELTKQLRAEKIRTPVLMLSAKDSVPDIVRGLNLGADDYLTKPFSFNELLARLRAVKRRAAHPRPAKLQVADLVLDTVTRKVVRGSVNLSLTRTEYSLLERLMSRAEKIVTRESLMESVWGFDREVGNNTLDVFVRLLRNKVDAAADKKLIHTVRGVGYMIGGGAQP